MATNTNHVLGIICIISGIVVILASLGSLLARIIIGLSGLSLINYGLKLRGLPPLQVLIPMIASRNRFFR